MNERIKELLAEIYEVDVETADFSQMSKTEILSAILTYEGIIGYTGWIINLIQDIYGVTLE